jgi:hypothetical protein
MVHSPKEARMANQDITSKPLDLLSKYGGSRDEMRELVRELEPIMKDWKPSRPPRVTAPRVFSRYEAEQAGMSLPSFVQPGWQVKVMPVTDPETGSPHVHFVTPEGWEITDYGTYISPGGKRYTEKELRNLGAEQDQQAAIQQLSEAMEGRRPSGPATPLVGLTPALPQWPEPSPEQQLAQVMEGQEPTGPAIPVGMTQADMEGLLTWADQSPDEFKQALAEEGRTPQTEAMLRAMFPDINDEELGQLFEGQAEPWYAEPLQMLREGGLQEGLMQNLPSLGDVGKVLDFLTGVPTGTHKSQFIAGVGDVLSSAGGAADWLGADGVADRLSEMGGTYQAVAAEDTLGEFSWKQLLNPEWYATRVTRALPFTLALIPAAVGGAYAGAGVAGAAGLGLFGKTVLGAVGASLFSRPLESALEAGGTYDQAIHQGMSPEEAEAAAGEVFRRNLALTGLDAAQFALAFAPAPVRISSKLIRTATIGGRVVVTGLTEAGEEAYQEVIQRQAVGEKVRLDSEMKQVMAIGGVMGVGIGEAGAVFNAIKSRTREALPETLEHVVEGHEQAFMEQGIEPEKAELLAMDEVAKYEGVQDTIKDVAEKVQKEQTQEKIRKSQLRERGIPPRSMEPISLEVPENERILASEFAPSVSKEIPLWVSEAVGLSKAYKGVSSRVLGPRETVRLESQAVEDIVSRAAVLRFKVQSIGTNAAHVQGMVLRSISTNPVKLFGFDERGISQTIPRLSEEATGTLEDIFTRPELYKLSPKQAAYVTRVRRVFQGVLSLLQREGIAPKGANAEAYIHRVVTGKWTPSGEFVPVKGRPGVGGSALGAEMSAAKRRKYPTMAEGIKAGVQYSNNPEQIVKATLADAYNGVADARFAKEIEEFGEKPAEKLAREYPGVVERLTLTKKQYEDLNKLSGTLKRAIRGEAIPEQTIRAVERRFPDWGRKLRGLTRQSIENRGKLSEYLGYVKRQYETVKDLLAKKEVAEAARRERRFEAVPDEEKLRDAFRVMTYEDRTAFRDAMDNRLLELQQMVSEQSEELSGIREFLQTDPVATYRGHVGRKKVALTSLLVRGKWPETITVKQAEMLLRGKTPSASSMTKGGRVRWEYVIDELADSFNMTEQGLIDKLENIADLKQKQADLEKLIDVAESRGKDVKKLLGVLDGVETTHEAIPKAAEGMPEAGLQQDIFGYTHPVYPEGKGKVTQISMEDYRKLCEYWKQQGLPGVPPSVGVTPAVEGVNEEAQAWHQEFDVPGPKDAKTIQAELQGFKNEVEALLKQKKGEYLTARAKRAAKMEQVKQPAIGEGYILQPMFGGKLYNQEFVDAINKFFGHEQGSKALKFTSDVAGIFRITKAALDFSAPAIQGQPGFGLAHYYLLTNPKVGAPMVGKWMKALVHHVAAFFDEGVINNYIAAHEDRIMQRVSMGGTTQSVDYFAALGARGGIGAAGERIMRALPAKPYHRADTAFLAFSEMVRDASWDALYPQAVEKGREFELARFLDRMTGIVDPRAEGVPAKTRQFESSWAWFAPRYTRACLSLVGHIFRGGYTGAQARRALGGLVMAGAAYYSGIQYALSKLQGEDDEDAWRTVLEGFGVQQDPVTGDISWYPTGRFMSFKVGNYNIGIGGFFYGLVRLAGHIGACIEEVGDRERIDLVRILKYGRLNRDNPFVYWWYSRSSTLVHHGRDFIRARTFFGTPIETPEEYAFYALTRFAPIWLEQGLMPYTMKYIGEYLPNLQTEYEEPTGAARYLLPFVELAGGRSFEEGEWTRFHERAEEIVNILPEGLLAEYYSGDELERVLRAQSEGRLEWSHLPQTLKAELRTMYPDLDDLWKLAIEASNLRDSDAWKDYTARLEEERQTRNRIIDRATERFLAGEIDAREWDELCDEAETLYSKGYRDIRDNSAYDEVFDYFEKLDETGSEYDWEDDIALAEYEDIIYSDDYWDEETQTYDWEERDRRGAEYIEKWGVKKYEKVLSYLREKKAETGINDLRLRHVKDIEVLGRDYWELPYKPLYRMEEDERAEVPAEHLALWETYQALDSEAEREDFLEENPVLAKDFRAEWRAQHPEDDARLKLWGYGGDLQSKEAYDILVGWTDELGFSKEALQKMELPPRNIVDEFFGYRNVQSEWGGNSPEAKLFRLDNPAFNDWGMEAYGWKSLEDENRQALRISVEWREMDQQYDSIEGREARAQFLEENPDYHKARRRRDAYQLDFPERLIGTYVDWYMTRRVDYEDDWFLLEHEDFYRQMVKLGVLSERDFSTVPTRKVWSLYQAYQGLPQGTPRLEYRAKHPELDAWLVAKYNYKPVSEHKNAPEPSETMGPWERAEEAERLQDWIRSQ